MARYLYAASPADYVLDPITGMPMPGAVVSVWTARVGGSQITDLVALDGVTAVTTVTADGQGFYAFYAPDGMTANVWAESGTGARKVTQVTESPAISSQVVAKAGDTMSGRLVLSGDPVLEMHAATKQYVDEHSSGSVNIEGGELSGNLVLGNGADLFIGATGQPRGQYRQQTDFSVVIQPSDNSGNLLGNKEFFYSVADGRWQFESGLRVDGALSVGGAVSLSTAKVTGVATGTDSADAVNKAQLDAAIPIGAIIAFGGTSAPAGWHICDGSAHGSSALQSVLGSANAPDLRGRFILGVSGTYARNSTGGAETHTLSAAESGVPAHTHPGSSVAETQEHHHTGTTGNQSANHYHNFSADTLYDGVHNHSIQIYSSGRASGSWNVDMVATSGGALAGATSYSDSHRHAVQGSTGTQEGSHTHTITTGGRSATHTHAITVSNNTASAASSAHNNMPPYYALLYIIKKA